MYSVLVLLLISFVNGERWQAEEQGSSWAKTAPKQEIYENIGPPPKSIPVFLSPFLTDGLSDPSTGLKTPVDFLALRMVRPKSEEERRRILKTKPLANIQFIDKPRPQPIFYNPRDRILSELQNGTKETPEQMWFNFEAMQHRNLNNFPKLKEPRLKYQVQRSKEQQETDAITRQQFRDSIMTKKKNENRTLNWTTCEEFKKKSKFHPKNLLDVDWLPFYTWSDKLYNVAVIHKFRSAPRKMVVRMKQELGSRLLYAVDWNQHKILMETKDMVLLIAADRTGLFYGIKDQPISDYFKRNTFLKYPVKLIRFKFVDRYVAMLDCDDYYATIMANIEDVPKTDAEKEKAAKVLKFTGTGQPVSRDLDMERMDVEARKALLQAQEEAKYIAVEGEDRVEKDQHLDLWS